MMKAHCGDSDLNHRGPQDLSARCESLVLIIRSLPLAKKTNISCPICKRKMKKIKQHMMGQLPRECLQPSPPWTQIGLDYACPFLVNRTVTARATKKVYLLFYTCCNTKVIDILVVDGYDTPSFQLRHEEFISQHGVPLEVQRVDGSNLKKAKKVLQSAENLGKELNYSDRVQGSTPNKPNWTLFYLKFITDNLTSLSLMFEGIFNVSGEILKIKFNISLLLAVLMWIQIAQFNFI